MTHSEGYASADEGLAATDVREVVTAMLDYRLNSRHDEPMQVYLVDAAGDRTPIRVAMWDRESDDAPNLFLYTEMPS